MSLHEVILGRALATEVQSTAKLIVACIIKLKPLGNILGYFAAMGAWHASNDEIFDSVCMYVYSCKKL
jgi:hypothetical protein